MDPGGLRSPKGKPPTRGSGLRPSKAQVVARLKMYLKASNRTIFPVFLDLTFISGSIKSTG
jgi:hypothetical protein